MGARLVTLCVSFSTSHHRSLLVKILLDVLLMDLPILLSKCKLSMAGAYRAPLVCLLFISVTSNMGY